MPCEHHQPLDVMRWTTEYLKEHHIPESEWEGYRGGYTDNVETAGHRSVYTEVTRRNGAWVITQIDRRPDPVPGSQTGLVVRAPE